VPPPRNARLLPLVLGAALIAGCSEIRMQTVDTQERVLGHTQRIVPGSGARVQARLDGTRLVLQASRGCELVAWERVEILEVREPDEDLIEETVWLVVGGIPLGIGIGLLVDAPHVYDHNRNSREYNATGQTGAYVAGTVLTAIGGLIVLAPIIQMMRVAGSTGEEVTTVSERRGATKDPNVRCPEGSQPLRTSVVLEVGAHRLATAGTDADGHLELDLADAIPREVAERAVSVKVIVSGKVVGEIDIQPILDEQRRRAAHHGEQSWLEAEPDRCRRGTDDEACLGVRRYLLHYPDGPHADEAHALLHAHALRQEQGGTAIAADPIDDRTRRAIEKARDVQSRLCAASCQQHCGGDARCSSTCKESCL
jgi:hypothetical protein